MAKEKYYITTAIDYVNAFPHLGHAMEKIQADALARYHRSVGEEVRFVSGTDENSLKNVQAAERAGKTVRELVDANAGVFRAMGEALELSYDDFIRTTEERHFTAAQKLWQACAKDIYKKTYSGLYCVGCEEYYKTEDLENGLCPEHQKKPELVEEENYFFKLSAYQGKIKELIENGSILIVPRGRQNEVTSFIDSGVEDICISRSADRAKGWGIPVPNDPTQIMWVWFDALTNYISALGYGGDEALFEEWWQNNPWITHVIGKGIVRFHAAYWIGMLLSAGLRAPSQIFVHGYITSEGQKMSKSLGNVVDPFALVKQYGSDAVRYFLLREIPSAEDGDFSVARFEDRYNADLAKGLGNFASRVVTIASKMDALSSRESGDVSEEAAKARERCGQAMREFKFNEALAAIWDLIGFCDRYIEKKQPWKTNDKTSVANLMFALEDVGKLVEPFIPETSKKIARMINGEKMILFPRLEKKEMP
jgi:methionyl-tRNA synthetase